MHEKIVDELIQLCVEWRKQKESEKIDGDDNGIQKLG